MGTETPTLFQKLRPERIDTSRYYRVGERQHARTVETGSSRITLALPICFEIASSQYVLSILGSAKASSPEQGQRTLSGFSRKDFEQEVVAPSAATSFHGDAIAAWMLL